MVSVAIRFYFFADIVDGQNFEGEIMYLNTYISKLANLTNSRLEELIGE